MRYPIESYDKHGYLKAPVWLWLGWLFLAKAWVVFVVAGVSRESGAKLLEIIYPDHTTLYIGLVAGIPVMLFSWLIGLRSPERVLICRVIEYGKPVSVVTILGQLALVGYQIYLSRGAFSWSNALTLVGLLWFLLFVMKSRRVRDCFHSPLIK